MLTLRPRAFVRPFACSFAGPRAHALVLPLLVLGAVSLAGCGSSEEGGAGGDGGLSFVDKAKTVQVCVDVAGSVQSAAAVGTQVASGALTQEEAATQLEPISTEVTKLAQENESLPIGTSLKELSEGIAGLEKVSSSAPAEIQAATESMSTVAKKVLDDCSAVGQ